MVTPEEERVHAMVQRNAEPRWREYVGFVWIGDEPGIRLSVWAWNSAEAREKLVAEYGEGHVYSIWNEEDASSER